MTVDYKFRDSGGIKRPFIPLNIINPHNNLQRKLYCLLDTGADKCVFNLDIVNILGHNLRGDGVISDITVGINAQSVTVWKHTFILQLLHPIDSSVIWESDSILIDCLEWGNVPPILGAHDFLSNFTITFDYQNDLVTLNW